MTNNVFDFNGIGRPHTKVQSMLCMDKETFTILDNYFTTKLFPNLVGDKVGSETAKVNKYLRAFVVLYALASNKLRKIDVDYLRAFIGYAPSSTRMNELFADLHQWGILSKNIIAVDNSSQRIVLKYMVNEDSDLVKSLKPIRNTKNLHIVDIIPDKNDRTLECVEYIATEWAKSNKLPSAPEPAPEELVKKEVPVQQQDLEYAPITGTSVKGKLNRDTVAVLVKFYNMMRSGIVKTYEDALALYNANAMSFLLEYPKAAVSLSVPTLRMAFKTWEREDNGILFASDSSSALF